MRGPGTATTEPIPQADAIGAAAPATEAARGPVAAVDTRRTALILLVLLSLIWGFHWVIVKVGLAYIPPLTYAASRIAIALVLMTALVAAQGRLRRPDRANLTIILSIGLAQVAARVDSVAVTGFFEGDARFRSQGTVLHDGRVMIVAGDTRSVVIHDFDQDVSYLATKLLFDRRGAYSLTAWGSSGRLYLGINDDMLGDNSGTFRVTIFY